MDRRVRRSMLFVPGNNPGLIIDAPVFKPDSIILDLEDAVSVTQKDAARELVVQSLRDLDFEGCETVIRLNGRHTPFCEADIRALVPVRPDVLALAMTETPEDIVSVDELVTSLEQEHGIETGTIKLMARIETAKGVLNARDIALCSKRLVAMSFGAEDFTNSIHSERTAEGHELLAARSAIVLAARAAGIDPIDTVYARVEDDEGFIRDATLAKQLGFAGKSCVHPRQVKLLHEVFRPTAEDVRRAQKVKSAIEEAERRGSGVISVDGRMVDGPIVTKALRILELATAAGLLKGANANGHGS